MDGVPVQVISDRLFRQGPIGIDALGKVIGANSAHFSTHALANR